MPPRSGIRGGRIGPIPRRWARAAGHAHAVAPRRSYHWDMATLELDDVHANAVDYQHFLLDSPSPYHAADLVAQRLLDAGFALQDEREAWDASPGGHLSLIHI